MPVIARPTHVGFDAAGITLAVGRSTTILDPDDADQLAQQLARHADVWRAVIGGDQR